MNSRIVFCILALTAAVGCSRKQAQQTDPQSAQAAAKAPEPVAVKTAIVETKNVDRYIDVTGSILPDDTVNLAFEVPGRIASIRFDFGQFVPKGAVIAELDKREFQLQVERAKAAVAQALARVGLEPGQEGTKPTESAAIRQARAQLEDARTKYESAKKLIASGDIAKERFTEAEKTFEARRAALEAMRDDLRTQLASIQALQADLKLAEKRLADTTLRAPFDGTISDRPATVGQYVKDVNNVVSLVKSWPLRVRLNIPEVATAGVHVGDTLRFRTEAIPDAYFTATVRQLNPELESRSRSLTAEARLNQADQRLRPGMFVQVRLTVSRNVPITVVPSSAIYTVAGLTKIFAIQDNKAREFRIIPGQAGEGWIEIPPGVVKPGDRVAVEKQFQLTDNMGVQAKL
jgi:RND family efflux transporter MFP subunit